MTTSRFPGFYNLTLERRRGALADLVGIDPAQLERPLLDVPTADHMIENVVGVYGLPLAVALNFVVNGRDRLVPMCVEEPSVVAAASNAARMVRDTGGFVAEVDEPIMLAQIQLGDVPDPERARAAIEAAATELLALADAAQPSLARRGGGARGLEVRILEELVVVHLLIDCRDAMGANMVNTIAEAVAPRLAELAGGTAGLRILSNLADRRRVRVSCRVAPGALGAGAEGARVRDRIVAASRFAELDPYRAATHNKGIMNGIDPVVIATGNDWRGVEAGAHAYAATLGVGGGYGPLATWRVGDDGALRGRLELPMAVGTVGGTSRLHPGARLALRLLGVATAGELAMVIASAGLASNLAALRALAAEGIQRGHMSLHARSVAVGAGARGELAEQVAAEMAAAGDVRAERARLILERLRGGALGSSPPVGPEPYRALRARRG
jgi:hydroxymethylglutaryl-CoA reductase